MNLYRPIRVALLLTTIGGAYVAIIFVLISKTGAPSRLALDDIGGYFDFADGVLVGGAAYRAAASFYPFLANILFAAVRLVSSLLNPSVNAFVVAWMGIAVLLYVCILETIIVRVSKLAVLMWLAPAPIYFALMRYDIYPAAATLFALLAIRRDSYLVGAAWLGLAIALKGYALFLLPAYCVYVAQRRDLAEAVKVGAVAVAPMLVMTLATIAFAGWDGLIAPFKFHTERPLNDETTYDAINYLFGKTVIQLTPSLRLIGHGLQVGCALIGAAFAPRRFDDLVHACLFAVVGFIAFSTFHSPQYVLWVLPIACLSSSRAILILALIFSWVSYLHLHLLSILLFGLLDAQQLYRLDVTTVSLLHFLLMAVAAYHLLSNRRLLAGKRPIWAVAQN
jgi:uncharacterized membrane protein